MSNIDLTFWNEVLKNEVVFFLGGGGRGRGKIIDGCWTFRINILFLFFFVYFFFLFFFLFFFFFIYIKGNCKRLVRWWLLAKKMITIVTNRMRHCWKKARFLSRTASTSSVYQPATRNRIAGRRPCRHFSSSIFPTAPPSNQTEQQWEEEEEAVAEAEGGLTSLLHLLLAPTSITIKGRCRPSLTKRPTSHSLINTNIRTSKRSTKIRYYFNLGHQRHF